MAILPVNPEDVENFTTVINPVRVISSSSLGFTGSIQLYPRNSKVEKEVRPLANVQASYSQDDDLELLRLSLKATIEEGKVLQRTDFSRSFDKYVSEVNNQTRSAKKQKTIEVRRFVPSPSFTSNTLRKLNVKDILMPYYRSEVPTAHWAYTNYHSLNFFSGPSVPSSSVLLYPMGPSPPALPPHAGHVTGSYALSGAFSFDFYINPRYQTDGGLTSGFKAGTIFHLSSSYALSLITGSKKDINGFPEAFRLQLQLSHSSDISPSVATKGSYPNDLVFFSDDNALEYNKWQRVVVRWGTNLVNDGTGSFNVDGVDKGKFVVPSGTIMPRVHALGVNEPKVLCVGNYYNGMVGSSPYFFTDVVSEREGLIELVDSGGMFDQPFTQYSFEHPLNAEIHDLAIRRYYMNDVDISNTSGVGTGSLQQKTTAFYLPPFFAEGTPIRKYSSFSDSGGIMQTPFFEVDGSTDDPFNVAMSFGVGGHMINLENFTKDLANGIFPRLHHLSGVAIDYTTAAEPANKFLYENPMLRKRNLTILPCDDGKFLPDFGLISGEIFNKSLNDFGVDNKSLISLSNLLNQESLLFGATHDPESDSSWTEEQIGFSPENPGIRPGPAVTNVTNNINSIIANDPEQYGPGVQRDVPLTIFQRTKDSSSNQVVFFDISNLYYGNRILPGSFSMTDSSLSGSAGRVGVTLRDDGFGNIYRADSQTENASWNSVGNIFYSEGVVVIKSPHLFFYGKDSYDMSFKGEFKLHSAKYEILAPTGLLNSSSNPTYILPKKQQAIFNKNNPQIPAKEEFEGLGKSLWASSDPLDNDKFVYISGVNFHDDNLNVIAKAVFVQPVIKREGEKILFKVTFDF
jgi:hypothetical protein